MDKLNYSVFINPFDITFLIICLISIFYGIKNGLLKSLFNFFKWILIFYLLKHCFSLLRPIVDQYIINETISDILIFLFTLITSYIFISFLFRLIIGFIQPKKKGLIDISFGGALGIVRGYIIFVIILSFINHNLPNGLLSDIMNEGSFIDIINFGLDFLEYMPRNFKEMNI